MLWFKTCAWNFTSFLLSQALAGVYCITSHLEPEWVKYSSGVLITIRLPVYLIPDCIYYSAQQINSSNAQKMALPPNIDFKTPLKEIPQGELTRLHNSPDHTGGFGDVWKCSWSTRSRNPPATVRPNSKHAHPHWCVYHQVAIKAVRVADTSQIALLEKTARVRTRVREHYCLCIFAGL